MPRPNRGVEGLLVGPCKVRKRGCSSSSSSSTILHNSRFKRAILVGRRGCSTTTPAPTWKMSSRSPVSSMVRAIESPKYLPPMAGGQAKQGPISARKLAATLWEMNEVPSSRVRGEGGEEEKAVLKKERNRRDRHADGSVRSGSLPRRLSDPSHSPVSEMIDSSSLRRKLAKFNQRITYSERNGGVLDSMSNTSLLEIESSSRAITPSGSIVGTKSRLRDVSHGLTTSKELLKILNRIWGLEDQHSSSISLIQALRGELERARLQVDQLIQEQKSDRSEINYWMKKCAEEKAALKSREQEKIRTAIQSVAEELEVEKKFRKRSESHNAKLSRELYETRTLLGKAMKELEGEKRARKILEHVCDELARGIGEDKAEVEELKIESAKVREELEKEREMLQLVDVLREERVQMKLSEAKFQFEEKNAAVDKLQNELEVFLGSQRSKEIPYGCRSSRMQGDLEKDDNGYVDNGEDIEKSEEKEDDYEEDEVDEDGSEESDLHSIELNVEDNSKGFRWCYAEDNLKRASLEEEDRHNKPTAEKNPKRLDRSLLEGIEWNQDAEDHRRIGIDRGRFSDSSIFVRKETKKSDYKNKMLKGLRNQIMASSKKGSNQGYGSSPARQSADSGSYQDPLQVVRERLKAAEMVKDMKANGLKARPVEGKGEYSHSRHQQHMAP